MASMRSACAATAATDCAVGGMMSKASSPSTDLCTSSTWRASSAGQGTLARSSKPVRTSVFADAMTLAAWSGKTPKCICM